MIPAFPANSSWRSLVGSIVTRPFFSFYFPPRCFFLRARPLCFGYSILFRPELFCFADSETCIRLSCLICFFFKYSQETGLLFVAYSSFLPFLYSPAPSAAGTCLFIFFRAAFVSRVFTVSSLEPGANALFYSRFCFFHFFSSKASQGPLSQRKAFPVSALNFSFLSVVYLLDPQCLMLWQSRQLVFFQAFAHSPFPAFR